jgi:cytochrome P450
LRDLAKPHPIAYHSGSLFGSRSVPGAAQLETDLELAALAVATWPALRASLSPPYWRAHVRPAVMAVAAIVGVGALAVVFAALSPIGLRLLAAVVCGGRLLALWQSRPEYGRSRGLPPGRLTLLPPLAMVEDDEFLARQAAEHGPVFKIGGLRRNVVCVVGLERGAALLRRHDAGLAVPAMPFSRAIPRGFLRFMGASDHAVYRRALQRGLSRDLVDGSSESLRRAVAGTLAAIARSSFDGKGSGIDPRPFLGRMTFEYLLELVLGVAASDPAFSDLERLFRCIDHLSVSPLAIRRARRALRDIAGRLAERPTSRRCLLSEVADSVPGAVGDPTLLGNLVFMVRASGADVAGLLSWILSVLGDHPEWLERLRSAESTSTGPEDLASRIVNETLRLQQSEFINRVALEPVEVDGFVVPRRWAIRLCVRESHRDPGIFVRPGDFDPDRFLSGNPPATEYAPFGMDRHACIGDHLTRTIGRTFVAALARGYDLTVAGNGRAVMGRAHWQPGPRFRVRLAARG